MSQNLKVLEYLKSHDSITTFESYNVLRITRLPARIKDLRKKGIDIDDEWDYSLNEEGNKVRFKRYRLGGMS